MSINQGKRYNNDTMEEVSNNIGLDDISLLQLADSFFPTGMYTNSNGLEALFYHNKKIKQSDELKDLIGIYLTQQIGPADCTILGNSYSFAQRSELDSLLRVDKILYAMKPIQEIREASTRSGSQLVKCVASFITSDELLQQYYESIKQKNAYGVFPVSLAIVCNTLKISKHKAGVMMLYSFTVSMIGAALRLGLLNHFQGQKIIHELRPIITDTVKNTINKPISDAWQFSPQIDLLQIKHENMDSKMFIT